MVAVVTSCFPPPLFFHLGASDVHPDHPGELVLLRRHSADDAWQPCRVVVGDRGEDGESDGGGEGAVADGKGGERDAGGEGAAVAGKGGSCGDGSCDGGGGGSLVVGDPAHGADISFQRFSILRDEGMRACRERYCKNKK